MKFFKKTMKYFYRKIKYRITVNNFKKNLRRKIGSNQLNQGLLSQNLKYKNIHLNKRCFILGNGPSLKSVDFSRLENEYVFTVNQIARVPEFYKLKTNYHFWADPYFFKININNQEDSELLLTMKNVNTFDNRPVCFFPVEQYNFVKQYNLESSMDVSYFMNYSRLSDYLNCKIPIDYTKPVPGFGTVVQWCITMAIYMGFSEIYLLGCDNTGLMGTLKTLLQDSDGKSHVYSTTENEEKRKYKIFSSFSFEQHISSYYNTFIDYRLLKEYCDNNNIKLINCSSTTLIDCIPRMDLDDVL